MKFRLIETPKAAPVVLASAYTVYSPWYDVGAVGGDSFSVVANVDVDTPTAKVVASSNISATTEIWTSTAHGFTTGLKVQLTTSTALPTPLMLLTDYFVINLTADTFQLAASLVNAQAGTPINLSDAGTGNQTVTPVALAGGAISLEQANNTDYPVVLGSSTSITVDAVVGLEKDRPTMRYVRVKQTLTAGHISSSLYVLVKGDLD